MSMIRSLTQAPDIQAHFEGIAVMAMEAAISKDRRLHLDALGALQLAAKELAKTLNKAEGRP